MNHENVRRYIESNQILKDVNSPPAPTNMPGGFGRNSSSKTGLWSTVQPLSRVVILNWVIFFPTCRRDKNLSASQRSVLTPRWSTECMGFWMFRTTGKFSQHKRLDMWWLSLGSVKSTKYWWIILSMQHDYLHQTKVFRDNLVHCSSKLALLRASFAIYVQKSDKRSFGDCFCSATMAFSFSSSFIMAISSSLLFPEYPL